MELIKKYNESKVALKEKIENAIKELGLNKNFKLKADLQPGNFYHIPRYVNNPSEYKSIDDQQRVIILHKLEIKDELFTDKDFARDEFNTVIGYISAARAQNNSTEFYPLLDYIANYFEKKNELDRNKLGYGYLLQVDEVLELQNQGFVAKFSCCGKNLQRTEKR